MGFGFNILSYDSLVHLEMPGLVLGEFFPLLISKCLVPLVINDNGISIWVDNGFGQESLGQY